MARVMSFLGIIFFGFFVWSKEAVSPIRIGAVFPVEGPMGDAMCISKAVAKFVRTNWSLPIEIIELENYNNEEGTFRAANKAVSEKLTAVIGTRTSQEAIIASNILDKAAIPFLAFMASHPDVVKNKKYSLRLLSNSDFYAEQIAQSIMREIGQGPLVIVRNSSSPYSDLYGKIVLDIIKKQKPNIKIFSFEIINGYKSYATLVEDIKKQKPMVVYAPLYTMEFTSLVGEIALKLKKTTIYSNGGFTDGIELIKKLSKKNPMILVKYNGVWLEKPVGPFAEIYRKILKEDCSNYTSNLRTALAFDSVMSISSAFKKNQNFRGIKFIDAFKRLKFDGVSGTLSYDSISGEPQRKLIFHQIQDGEFNVIEP